MDGVTADGVESESNVPNARKSSSALARTLTRLSLDFEVGSKTPVEELGANREMLFYPNGLSRGELFSRGTALNRDSGLELLVPL